MKETLESFLFFNTRQHLQRDSIIEVIAEFGHPQIVETTKGLTVKVPKAEAQTLFAFDPRPHTINPAGVVVFLRTAPAEIIILHLAIHPTYALHGRSAGRGCGVLLFEKVLEVAAQISGVERVVFYYQKQVTVRVISSRSSQGINSKH